MTRPISHLALSLCFVATLICPHVAVSFEQGSYFVFDLVESDKSEAKAGRLALKKEVFAVKASKSTDKTSLKVDDKDFIADFSQPIQAGGNSSFKLETSDFGADESSSTQDDLGFDFGTSGSVFGD